MTLNFSFQLQKVTQLMINDRESVLSRSVVVECSSDNLM